jgi:flagellar basal-body rod modification protein FlgD
MFLSAISNAGAAGTTVSDRQGIADNFDTFLTILTTQLQNQNPLEPLDTNEFTQQLVQFSEVEQAIKQTEQLEAIARVAAASAATNAVSFIGKAVSVASTTTTLSDGAANWSYESEASADAALFSIRDSSGQTVWTGERSLNQGRGTFAWDGRNNQGQTMPAGQYSLTIDARDQDNATISVDIEVDTIIDGVDFAGDEPVLMVGGQRIPLGDVKTVTAG